MTSMPMYLHRGFIQVIQLPPATPANLKNQKVSCLGRISKNQKVLTSLIL